MRKYRSYKISAFHESLEPRLSLSSLVAGPANVLVVDDPPPDPEPDPGDLPIDEPPILVPPIPPSGPVGPGIHLQPTQMTSI